MVKKPTCQTCAWFVAKNKSKGFCRLFATYYSSKYICAKYEIKKEK